MMVAAKQHGKVFGSFSDTNLSASICFGYLIINSIMIPALAASARLIYST